MGQGDDSSSSEGSGQLPEVEALVASMTDDEKLWCLDGDLPCWAGLSDLTSGGYHRRPFPAARVPRLGLRGIAFSDGPRGVVIDHATCFPVTMARGASWDPDLEERVGDAIGTELKVVGADLYGGVCVNVLRHPAWGRAQETYGEDPFHVGELGAALTRGIQRHAMACVKHFACNSMENARFRVDVAVDEVALHEVYLPHFRRIVDEGVASVMSAYNRVNGAWAGESHELLTEVLREEWGFEGFVISDFIFGLRDGAASVSAGLDIEMPFRMIRAGELPAALEEGRITWAEIDRAVGRIVSTRRRFEPVLATPAADHEILNGPAHRALAREVAAKSMVLLRNEPVDARPVLPLDEALLSSVAVIGSLADTVNLGDGGSSDVWATDVVTPLAGLRAAFPRARVVHDDGTDLPAAARTAASADVAVVVVGYTCADEGEFIGDASTAHLAELFPAADDPVLVESFLRDVEVGAHIQPPDHVGSRPAAGFAVGGDRRSLRLHAHDVALIEAVAGATPRCVVVVMAGSAVLMSDWDHMVPAVLHAWYPGVEGGTALADVLLGRCDPRGRLPFSIPEAEEHLPAFDRDADQVVYDRWHGWWHLDREGHRAAYPFGFGLGYTTFELRQATITGGPSITVEALLENTGERPGSEVIQVYARRRGYDGAFRLVGFARIDVGVGEQERVIIEVDMRSLAERDTTAHEMRARSGHYEVRVARNAADPGSVSVVAVDP